MERKLFWYTRKEKVEPTINGEEIFKSYRSSFSLEKVVRSEELENGNILVLLDDIHQRPVNTEVTNKQGKVTAIKREMGTFQSEIFLTEKDDIENFYKLTNAAL
jgi:hypothetical protein